MKKFKKRSPDFLLKPLRVGPVREHEDTERQIYMGFSPIVFVLKVHVLKKRQVVQPKLAYNDNFVNAIAEESQMRANDRMRRRSVLTWLCHR